MTRPALPVQRIIGVTLSVVALRLLYRRYSGRRAARGGGES